MATLVLAWNTTNSIPSSSGDPLRYKSFTVDFIDFKQIKEISVVHDMLNRSIEKDIIGIQRRLRTFIRPADIIANRDFLESFFSAAYRWALTPDTGHYFNLGTDETPVMVPVQFEDEEAKIDVPGLIEDGLTVISKDVYQKPPAQTTADFTCVAMTNGYTVYCDSDTVKCKVYDATSTGGALTYRGEASEMNSGSIEVPIFVGAGGVTRYVKIVIVTIGGESLYSAERSVTTI